MLLVHTQKITPRLNYVFRHICTSILGVKVEFTSVIETFISHSGPKISYGKVAMGNELFFQSHGLLTEQGFEDVDVALSKWNTSVCFFPMSDKSALPFDIFAASFYLLSRYEEYLPHVKDELGRFPVSESLAFKGKFLEKPVVDLWAYELKKILLANFPDLEFTSNSFKFHHVVEAKRPFEFAHRGFLRNFFGYFRDLSKFRITRIFSRSRVLLKLRKDPFDTFTWMINSNKNTASALSVFFLLGEGMSFREDLNTKKDKFEALVKYVGDYNEVGLILSYHSLHDYDQLNNEKKQMEELTHRSLNSTMNDQFKVNLPNSYRDLLELEVNHDFTMLYENAFGFRAGTCTPFLFYDLDYEIKTPLLIHPMAGATSALKKLRESEAEMLLETMVSAVQMVNGTFSMLFSNKDFVSSKENHLWRFFFSEN